MRWEVLLGISVGLQLLPGLCSGVLVTQKERFMMIQVGANASIPCQHDDTTFLYIYWYWQKSSPTETQLQLIGYSAQGNDPVMEMDKTKFTIDRPNVKKASLIVAAAQTADAASYFCAASQGTACALCLTAIHKHLSASCSSIWATNSPQTDISHPESDISTGGWETKELPKVLHTVTPGVGCFDCVAQLSAVRTNVTLL